MVLSGPKKTSMIASTTNQVTIFGSMGGLPPNTNRRASLSRFSYCCNKIPAAPGAGLAYMINNGLMGRGGACSGVNTRQRNTYCKN
jgi:hypothetical protein